MSRKAHQYRITLTPLEPDTCQPGGAEAPLVFDHRNHDDIKPIVERVRRNAGLDADSAAAMAVGLKLLAEVMLEQRDNPLFDVLRAPVREFIQGLKARAAPGSGQ